ncbi:MAG: 4Fe-4S binding protein [Mariniphaga sp.]|nr:4Fe-4S binding protein [Mariniphaga sp.]MDD4425858.1 4Fe-4S binding protein [Mariniphaga sp.]
MDEIAESLKDMDVPIIEMRDLCSLSVREKGELEEALNSFSKAIFIACYPRAVRSMLIQAGINPGNSETISFKEYTPKQILQKIKEQSGAPIGKADYRIMESELDIPAWYPVIDQSRCILCGKCAKFCLFGVYHFDRKSLKVVHPLACKNQCPACGRTCPTSAIIFPRMPEKSPLAGAEPDKDLKSNENGSLFVLLNERNRNRRSIFREGIVQQAEEERRKALEELKNTQNRKTKYD